MVEELFPASVPLVAKVDMDERIVLRLDGFLDERHAGLSWHSPTFPDVARGTSTNDVFPSGFTAESPWDDVVERKFASREALAAILTPVLVASENVPAIEFDLASGQTVVEE